MILIRETIEKDILDIYKNIHEPYVKKYCNNIKIEWENHKKWYNFLINSDSYLLFTILDAETNEFYGYVKFELEKEIAIINIYLIPNMRHRGYGEKIISLSIEELKVKYPKVSIVLAYILEENIASKNTFKHLGFSYDGTDDYKGIEHLLYIKFI